MAQLSVFYLMVIAYLCSIPMALGQCSCGESECCSQSGSCGLDPEVHCGYGCQAGPCRYHSSEPPPYEPPPSAGKWVTGEMWDQLFPHRNDERCPAAFFYEHKYFLTAAESVPDFGTTGDEEQQKREVAAFLAHAAHETGLRVGTVPDGPLAWGLCLKEESPCLHCCGDYNAYQCADGHNYCGRGPLMLKWNYEYGAAGDELGFDGINNPEAVAQDSVLSFKVALRDWMRGRPPKPKYHDILTGKWQPSADDYEAHRQPGFGVTINIINSGECGHGYDITANERIQIYTHFCQILGVEPGDNLDCGQQWPYT